MLYKYIKTFILGKVKNSTKSLYFRTSRDERRNKPLILAETSKNRGKPSFVGYKKGIKHAKLMFSRTLFSKAKGLLGLSRINVH